MGGEHPSVAAALDPQLRPAVSFPGCGLLLSKVWVLMTPARGCCVGSMVRGRISRRVTGAGRFGRAHRRCPHHPRSTTLVCLVGNQKPSPNTGPTVQIKT